MRLIQPASYLMPWSTSLLALARHLWTSQESIAASTSTPVYKVSISAKLGARKSGSFRIGGDIEVWYSWDKHGPPRMSLWVISGHLDWRAECPLCANSRHDSPLMAASI